MICARCARAADARAPRDQHCDDPKCPCGHRAQQPAETDWATVPLAVVDRTPPRLIATELLDEADAQPSLAPLLAEHIKAAFGDVATDTTTED